jgi:WD40 repeat protein
LWSATGKPLATARAGFTPDLLVFAPDGTQLIATAQNGRAAVIESRSGTLTELAVSVIADVAIDATRIAFASNREVVVFDRTTRTRLARRGTMLSVALFADGRIATADEDGTVALWSSSGERLAVLPIAARPFDLEISPDGALLAIGMGDGSVELWDATTYQRQLVFRGHRGFVQDVRFTAGGQRLFSVGDDGRVASWDLARRSVPQQELAKLAACRVPFELVGDSVLPKPIDDASCR